MWSVAAKLYPTFTDVLLKVREIIADEADAKNNPHAMDVDDLEESGGDWQNTGQTLVGKGPQG